MVVKLKTSPSAPDRLFAYVDEKSEHAGTFRDNDEGTSYISRKCPKGEFLLIGLKAMNQQLIDRKSLPKFVELIESQKIPNVPFKLRFTTYNLTEDGFKEFLMVLFPKRKAKKKTTRRYYLHSQIKKCGCVRMGATDKAIYVSLTWPDSINQKIIGFVNELSSMHGYSIQQEIQDASE